MATDPLTDATLARDLLQRAVAHETNPVLSVAEVDSLMTIATSLDVEGVEVFTGADLNRAASLGWQWKAAKVAADFNVALPEGQRYDRAQAFEHFMDLAGQYASGAMSVLGSSLSGARGGIATIGLVSTLGSDGTVF